MKVRDTTVSITKEEAFRASNTVSKGLTLSMATKVHSRRFQAAVLSKETMSFEHLELVFDETYIQITRLHR